MQAFGPRFRPLAMAGLVLMMMAAAAAARAQYVVYYRAFGQWTVICALDEPTARTRCELRAPQPSLDPVAEGVRVEIVEPPAGEAAVILRFNVAVDAGRGVSLVVDNHPPRAAGVSRTGEAAWSGPVARGIVAEMTGGSVVAIRFVRWGDTVLRERRFDLKGFPEAHRAYLQRSGAAGAAAR